MLTFLHPKTKLRTDTGWVEIKNFNFVPIMTMVNKKLIMQTPSMFSHYPEYFGNMIKLKWTYGSAIIKPNTKFLSEHLQIEAQPKTLFSFGTPTVTPTYTQFLYKDELFAIGFKQPTVICAMFKKDYFFIEV